MKTSTLKTLFLGLVLVWISCPVALADGLGFHGWGPRAGFSADPDQIFGGVHLDLGELTDQLRLQPNLEFGFGDDVTVVAGAAAVLWLFETDWDGWRPYTGGEVGLTYLDFDHRDSDTEFALNAVGGVETRLHSDNRLFFELKLGILEEPDLKILVGWTF